MKINHQNNDKILESLNAQSSSNRLVFCQQVKFGQISETLAMIKAQGNYSGKHTCLCICRYILWYPWGDAQ